MSLLNRASRSVFELDLRPSGISPALGEVDQSSSLLGRCSNPGCRSSWLQLFRYRTRPNFETGWTCSPDCTESRLRLAVRRELQGPMHGQETHRHRVPLGLLMHEKGWITTTQLRRAIEAQRESGTLRIGEWLVRQGATDEGLVTRALSLQWSCPVLSPGSTGLRLNSCLLPRLFVDAFGSVPLLKPSQKILYLGFEQKVDQALALCVARTAGVRVECGIVPSSTFADNLRMLRAQSFPEVQIAEASTGLAAAHVFAKAIERGRPCRSCLVRVHDWLWLRMIRHTRDTDELNAANVSDVVCRIVFI